MRKLMPYVVWIGWVILCALFIYGVFSFVVWGWFDLTASADDRIGFLLFWILSMGITFWLPGIIIQDHYW